MPKLRYPRNRLLKGVLIGIAAYTPLVCRLKRGGDAFATDSPQVLTGDTVVPGTGSGQLVQDLPSSYSGCKLSGPRKGSSVTVREYWGGGRRLAS